MLFEEPEVIGWIVGAVITCVIILFLFIVFMATRYRKFKTNQFVIHLRNGKVKTAGLGGALWLLPLIDEYIVIPTTSIQTILEAHDQVVSKEYQNIEVVGMLIWKVVDPERAFSAVSWFPRDDNYVEKILKGAAEAIIRTTCANMPLELIIRERREIIEQIAKDLHELTADWGVVIESFEILEVIIVEQELKKNMEAVKQAEEYKKARIAKANAERESKLRELEIQNEVGTQEQLVESNFLHYLNERIAERIIDYTYYVQTNSNVISLKEPYYLQYNLEKLHDNSLKEDLKLLDLKDCQYCGNLNAAKARYCTYCGIKL